MKETIKHYFPLVLTVLCTIFATYILFHSFSAIGKIFSNITLKNNQTLVSQQLEESSGISLPAPKYIGGTLTTEEPIVFHDLFSIGASEESAIYLVDIKKNGNTSVLTSLSTSNIDKLEDIPSAAIYDKEKQLLYFYSSGIYTFYIRLYYKHYPGILFECQVPVEMR